MDPAVADFARSVLWELRFIHWLLIALLLLVAFLVYVIFAMLRGLGTSVRLIEKQQDEKQFNQGLEDLLTQGRAKEALFAATENLRSRPKDPNLHWYLGQAQFQLANFIVKQSVVFRRYAISRPTGLEQLNLGSSVWRMNFAR